MVFSNRDQRTLLDQMILLLESLDLKEPFYFVADAHYATGKIARGLLAQGNHLVTRVRSNSVAWCPATPPPPLPLRFGGFCKRLEQYHTTMNMIPDQVMHAIHFAEFVMTKEKKAGIGSAEDVVDPMKFFLFHGQKEIMGLLGSPFHHPAMDDKDVMPLVVRMFAMALDVKAVLHATEAWNVRDTEEAA